MSGNQFGLIELILVFGCVLGFGVWQLWSVRRSKWGDDNPGRDGEGDREG